MEAAGKRYIVHPSRSDTFTIWGLGDLHLGAPGCDEKRFKRDVEAIKNDPFSYWIGLGDVGDYIAPGDKRFSADHLSDEAKLNVGRLGKYFSEKFRDMVWEIRGKCFGLGMGNHEWKYQVQNNQEDLHSWLCEELEVPNLRYSSLFDVVFIRKSCKAPRVLSADEVAKMKDKKDTRHSYRILTHHGSGGSSTPAGKLNVIIKHMEICPNADIGFFGHLHDSKCQRLVTLDADANCQKIVERQRVGVMCGSYLKTYTQGVISYGEMKGYKPTSLGAARVTVVPDRREVRGEA